MTAIVVNLRFEVEWKVSKLVHFNFRVKENSLGVKLSAVFNHHWPCIALLGKFKQARKI